MAVRTFSDFMKSGTGGAEWYFIGATFAFASSSLGLIGTGWPWTIISLVIGFALVVAGGVVWSNAARKWTPPEAEPDATQPDGTSPRV
ncbi:hypothetical protein MN032_17600 [Agromyces atrinae]|uniref:hypothetical protein n=1 Tax=Agromyces atrinae TaxID=592376 RepID=UPI001F586F3F|nr:hypothetical protein [Agromyces atrinae]MCI2959503.1 hypothetical protein [Agromyces atrinae]